MVIYTGYPVIIVVVKMEVVMQHETDVSLKDEDMLLTCIISAAK